MILGEGLKRKRGLFGRGGLFGHLRYGIYVKLMGKNKYLYCIDAGLRIAPKHPILGARTDGFINCTCCGNGILEIKCPYTHRDKSISEYTSFSVSCIEFSEITKSYVLKPQHAYHTQVQYNTSVICHWP